MEGYHAHGVINFPERQIMITKDFHGLLLDEALQEAELIIGTVRTSGKAEQAEFITGFGVIRTEVFELLEQYSLSPHYKIGNAGTITVYIE